MYLANATRPDIAYSVSFLARSMTNPSQLDYQNAKRVLRYLKGTSTLKLTYGGTSELVGYSDASYAEDKEDRKSTSGYAFLMNGAAVSWKSSKLKIVSLSSMEAEYIGLSNAKRSHLVKTT